MNSPLISGSYYHIFNRGVEKRTVFQSSSDYQRFLQTLDYYRFYPTKLKLSTFLNLNEPPLNKNLKQQPLVRILCFCLMSNHFHLLIQQLEENGISEFMRRVLDSYTRYFNTKNERVGSLFQGKFKAKIVEKDEYLLYLTKYIHRNPMTLPKWKHYIQEYGFSSYPGYLNKDQNFPFCEPEEILGYFGKNKTNSYKSFVEESEDLPIPEDLLIEE